MVLEADAGDARAAVLLFWASLTLRLGIPTRVFRPPTRQQNVWHRREHRERTHPFPVFALACESTGSLRERSQPLR
jgi:hypothetical protein